jgi:hypothetical protein
MDCSFADRGHRPGSPVALAACPMSECAKGIFAQVKSSVIPKKHGRSRLVFSHHRRRMGLRDRRLEAASRAVNNHDEKQVYPARLFPTATIPHPPRLAEASLDTTGACIHTNEGAQSQTHGQETWNGWVQQDGKRKAVHQPIRLGVSAATIHAAAKPLLAVALNSRTGTWQETQVTTLLGLR